MTKDIHITLYWNLTYAIFRKMLRISKTRNVMKTTSFVIFLHNNNILSAKMNHMYCCLPLFSHNCRKEITLPSGVLVLQHYDVGVTCLTARIWLGVAVWSLGDVHGYLTVFVLWMYVVYFSIFVLRAIIVLIKLISFDVSSSWRLRDFE